MDPTLEAALQVGIPLALLVATYFSGGWVERRHYASIRQREVELRTLPAISFRTVPTGWNVERSALVSGSVVISVDYFKRFLAGLRGLIGGRIKSYESLLDRARREALLRMKAEAAQLGFDAVVNVRIETSRMANGQRNGGTAGIEVLAFGTGLELRESLS